MNLQGLSIDREWTLFLDRDGVINERIAGGYVTSWESFRFIDHAKEAIGIMSGIFGRIIVATNQQGIGKGLMIEEELNTIHQRMVNEIRASGGRVDAIYFSPHLERENHPDRKPGTGMVQKALADFPDIDLDRAVMAGDSLSDMEFGRNAGMLNVLIGPDDLLTNIPTGMVDRHYRSLFHFARELSTQHSALNTQH